jgi:heterodisulfide reductase subunit A-like polyferredoxin
LSPAKPTIAFRDVDFVPLNPSYVLTSDPAAIVGAGAMGGSIAISFAEFGFPVDLLEVTRASSGLMRS